MYTVSNELSIAVTAWWWKGVIRAHLRTNRWEPGMGRETDGHYPSKMNHTVGRGRGRLGRECGVPWGGVVVVGVVSE
jgi:hypothetical protein